MANVCIWWQCDDYKWCMAPAYTGKWIDVWRPFDSYAEAEAKALDLFEEVIFFDGSPDDLEDSNL